MKSRMHNSRRSGKPILTIILLVLASFLGSTLVGTPVNAQAAQAACAPTTITLNLVPIADSYVDSSNPTLNYGSAPTVNVESTLSRSGVLLATEISYLTFNMSAIPKGMIVENATLGLYLASHSTAATGNVSVYSGSSTTWNELTIDYLNAPTYSTSPLATIPAITTPGLVFNFSVTSDFKSLATNMTLVLGSNLPSGVISFGSRESTHPPKLTVAYGPITDCTPPAVSPVKISPSSPSSEDLVTVSANVTDQATLSSVTLTYTVNSSNLIQLSMVHGSGNAYSAVIDRQSSGSTVSLNVTATDIAGLRTIASATYVVSRPDYYFALLSQYNTLLGEYNSLQAALANLTATLPSLQAFKSLQASDEALQKQYNNLLSTYSTLESNYVTAQNQLANLTKGISNLSSQYNTLNALLSQTKSSLNNETTLAIAALVAAAVLGILLAYIGYVRPRAKGQGPR